ncbi:type II toxin-antitoxin system VapC family toxin [Candidatus Micrarchaeota archaeon]|nr:type II toxin-antitoxin system VapC family toxin [Candidatus Micrarchaeota archaeon]
MTVLIDSSAWLEYFLGTTRGERVRRLVLTKEHLLVSPINIVEVYVKESKEENRRVADECRAFMTGRCEVADVTEKIAFEAAKLGLEKKLGLADALIYATASLHGATLLTLDNDFRGLPSAEILEPK